MKWEILSKNKGEIIETLLKNRGIKNEKDFFVPKDPYSIKLSALGIKDSEVKKSINRIKLAKKNKDQVIVYGDYDADGICSTAILWEALHSIGLDVLPHIPDRFEEGYGLNAESIENLKSQISNLKLIVTVDNGIVAYEGIKKAKELGIDIIVIDHHQTGAKKLKAYSVIHSTAVCGSALAWLFAKELLAINYSLSLGLELAAIGTIADQMSLTGINRSIVKFGLTELNETKRPGLLALIKESKIEEIGTYEVNYIIAPRINAMGRLAAGIDSLRLLCTKRSDKALELSKLLSKTNVDRQKMVDSILIKAIDLSKKNKNKLLVISHSSFHEGVIGLAAGKLVEEFYRPAIVFSEGKEKSKASARSISGFNIIEAIRSTGLILEGGGHPMAAGFSLETSKIEKFTKEINKIADKLLTQEILEKKLKVDMEIDFENISYGLNEKLKEFNPTGMGNPTPVFMTKDVEVLSSKSVGRDSRHLKMKLKQNGHVFDSIFFGGGKMYSDLKPTSKIDVVYNIEENIWNGNTNLQLKLRDLKTRASRF